MLADSGSADPGQGIRLNDFAASFQNAVVSVLVDHTVEAAERFGMDTVCVAGGVAANTLLRSRMASETNKAGIRLYIPERIYCTDNAAMTACAGTYSFFKGNIDDMSLNAYASLAPGERH